MLHSTSSTDEQRYLPTTTATRGSGLQSKTSALHSGPSHPEPASPIYWRLHPRSSQDVPFFQVPASARERRVPTRCHGGDSTAAFGSEGQSRHKDGKLAILVDQDMP